jgi:hypothetical protein
LEITIHGLRRSFRFWAEHEKQEYLSLGNKIIETLRPLTEHICFGFGIVLGHIRTGDFISHDDDVDILIAFDRREVATLSAGLSLVSETLRAHGFRVDGDFISHRWVFGARNVPLDVFVGLIEEDGRLSFYPARRNIYELHDIFPANNVKVFDTLVPFPKNVSVYLEKTYGPKWRIPNSKFGHAWNSIEYADIA